MLNGLDLFSGIGGLTIALAPWVRPVAYCENDRFAQAVLLSRMSEGAIPRAPIWNDVQTLSVSNIAEPIDILYGGFPCQPYSSAARGRNPDCTLRSEFARIINDMRPRYVFAENTTLQAVYGLAELLDGYQASICHSSAAQVGRPFIGKRYWMVATANGDSKSNITVHDEVAVVLTPQEVVWEEVTCESIRMDDGLPNRMERLRALGNAVVPLQARAAFKRLMGIHTAPANPGKEVSE